MPFESEYHLCVPWCDSIEIQLRSFDVLKCINVEIVVLRLFKPDCTRWMQSHWNVSLESGRKFVITSAPHVRSVVKTMNSFTHVDSTHLFRKSKLQVMAEFNDESCFCLRPNLNMSMKRKRRFRRPDIFVGKCMRLVKHRGHYPLIADSDVLQWKAKKPFLFIDRKTVKGILSVEFLHKSIDTKWLFFFKCIFSSVVFLMFVEFVHSLQFCVRNHFPFT